MREWGAAMPTMNKSDRRVSRAPLSLGLLAAAVLLAGCSMIPAYERPEAPVAADWPSNVAFAAAGTSQAPEARAADLPWQDYFADERLRRLIGLALDNNRDLRLAMLNVEQVRAQYQIQRANLFPAVNLSSTAQRAPNVVNGNLTNSFSVGLAVSAWEIDFFGRLSSLKEQALAQYLASDEGRKAAQISLVSAVANGWLALLADEELIDLSRRTVATREESIRLTRLRLDNGVASELDFRQAESLTETARATLAQQLRQRAQDENALVLLLGQSLPEDLRAETARLRLADAPQLADLPAGLPSELLVNRPDIRQSEQQLLAANANIGAARAAFFPRIALTAQAGTSSSELDGLFKSGSWGFTLAPQLLLPIFDAGRNRAGLASATAGRDIAVAQYEKSIQTAFREVADALAGRATLGEQLRAQQAQARAESIRLNLSDLRYKNGVSSYLDLLDAQRSLFTAQQLAVQTRLLQLQNQVTLYRVLGGGWTEPPAVPVAAAAPGAPTATR
ncbi:multidrug efflux system outer membrane protein [Xylophilus ampelinus]|uniref:Multidrug efflux system outer membrane protein n=2 Tax=Xylophilus ampelinus TaxID=54067 RepID=A0A318SDU8_9BURK|nr:multidrug efflux system outer membrane protein [Xylophilus ampelinus]